MRYWTVGNGGHGISHFKTHLKGRNWQDLQNLEQENQLNACAAKLARSSRGVFNAEEIDTAAQNIATGLGKEYQTYRKDIVSVVRSFIVRSHQKISTFLSNHKEEIEAVKAKMNEEKERLRFLKESGDLEEYTPPKRAQTRAAFTEMPTIPDIDLPENTAQEGSYSNEDTTIGASSVIEENDEEADEPTVTTDTDEESYFSDKNR